MNHQRKPELWKHLPWNDRVSSLKSFKTVYLLLLLILCSVFFIIIIICFFGLFFFSFCLRRASSITWASQTQIKSMAHWLPQQQTWTHVCLPDSYKKETGIQIGLHCLMEGKRTDHWQSWHKSISDSWKPLFYGLPWFPLVPCLVSVDIGME